jgi:hypothetical protein
MNDTSSPDISLSRIAGPDFICVGMAKAGTSWLYDQLYCHPDFWMPPVKDWGYLKHSEPRMGKKMRRRLRRLARPDKRTKVLSGFSNRREDDTRDAAFLEEAGTTSGVESYISLFRHKEGMLSGDITPGYAALPSDSIAEIARKLLGTKIILLVRDPVSRAWSHTSMWQRGGNLPEGTLDSAQSYRTFLESPGSLGGEHFPTRVATRWEEQAPNLSFRYFLFDDLARDPEGTRHDILCYLGADPAKASGDLSADYNSKTKKQKLDLPDNLRAVLVDFFREELLNCANHFGGAARAWPARYGL